MSITMHTGPNAAPPAIATFATRLLTLCYGGLAYLIFFGTFLYAVGFVSRICRAKDRRYRFDVLADDGLADQSGADVDLRRAAQRHGAAGLQEAVHALRVACDRTLDLCAAGESDADIAVLAMAADAVGGLEHRKSCCRRRRDCWRLCGLAHRALQHLPDQPFRAVRIDPGGDAFCRARGSNP